MQVQQSSLTQAQKFARTQRFPKQMSQGSSTFATNKNTASSNAIVRLSENSYNKSKTIITTSRAGSIPKAAAREAREFGREINQNSAMSAIS